MVGPRLQRYLQGVVVGKVAGCRFVYLAKVRKNVGVLARFSRGIGFAVAVERRQPRG